MFIAHDARLVLRWTCQACQHVNYYTESAKPSSQESVQEASLALGLDPQELAIVPEVLCCQKCEEAHKLPDDLGMNALEAEGD